MTVTTVADCLAELGAALRTRGAARRRFLRECRDHLTDTAAEGGEASAVRAFGPPAQIAAAFDAEVASTRAVTATFLTVGGVALTGGSTLALIHAASTAATAPVWWAICFFVAAQLAAVSAGMALLQALVGRRTGMSAAHVRLLARRDACALVAAGAAMFSAGAALPGRGSAVVIVAGPVLVCVALVAVLRARWLALRLPDSDMRANRQPFTDIARLLGIPEPTLNSSHLLVGVMALAAAAAFLRDRAEHANLSHSLLTAGIEATAVAFCFFTLGATLGIRLSRTHAPSARPEDA